MKELRRKQLDNLYATLDRLSLEQVDCLLREVMVDDLDLALLIGILTFTLPMKESLPSRVPLLHRIKERLLIEVPTRAEAILENL